MIAVLELKSSQNHSRDLVDAPGALAQHTNIFSISCSFSEISEKSWNSLRSRILDPPLKPTIFETFITTCIRRLGHVRSVTGKGVPETGHEKWNPLPQTGPLPIRQGYTTDIGLLRPCARGGLSFLNYVHKEHFVSYRCKLGKRLHNLKKTVVTSIS